MRDRLTVDSDRLDRRAVAGVSVWLALVACLIFHPVHAQLEPEASAYNGWKVKSLTLRGLDKSMAKDLAEGLALSKKPEFYPKLVVEDIDRSLLFLARRGYPYAEISAEFSPDDETKKLEVILDFSSGPPVVVRQVVVEGMPDRLAARASGQVTVKKGDVLSDGAVAHTTESLLFLLMDSGYARSDVAVEVDAIDTVSVNVGFNAQPGLINYFRNINVENASEDLIPLTKKVTGIRKGRRYKPKRIQDAQDNLRRLDLFRRIRVETEEVGSDSLDVLVDVAARKPQTLKAGISYWNDEGFRLEFSWRHRNLFRHGRGLFVGMTGSLLLQRFDLSMWWPALIAPRTKERISLFSEREDEEAYEQVSTGAEISSTYYFTLDDNIRTALSVSDVEVSQKTKDEVYQNVEAGLLTELSIRLNQNSTDNPFNPTMGVLSWSEVRWAPSGKISDNHYILWEVSGSTYWTVLTHTIVAMRVAGGIGSPIGASDVILPSKRFFSGGANSMRGFSRRRLGPKDEGGAPVGGEAKVEASFEVRRPLFWRIWGALFADAGNVWRNLDAVRLDRMEIAVGPGVWLMTPVGPLRFDVGYRLTFWDEGESRWAYHISIGPAF